MDFQLGPCLDITPLSNEIYYEICIIRMKEFLGAIRYDVWNSVVIGYTPPKRAPKSILKKQFKRNNKQVMDSISEGLPKSVKRKIRIFTLVKELWDKMKSLYMVEEVIKISEESDEKYERSSCNDNNSNVEYFQSKEETYSTSNNCGRVLDEDLIITLYFEFDPSENKNFEIKEEDNFEEQIMCSFDEIMPLIK
jgi:hypothetical protein